MIESTFILLHGVGEATERKLWSHGVETWEAFLAVSSLPGIGRDRKRLYDDELQAARDSFRTRDARYFARRLKLRDQWRLYRTFRPRTVYLDIETTGGSASGSELTMVGLYADGRMTTLVNGVNLSERRLEEELAGYDLLVTFFGSVFDLPYLRAKYPRLRLDHPHVDLCFVARRLGLRGGLKLLEEEMGIGRDADLHGLNGWDAVRLWSAAQQGDDDALDRLRRYNEADCRNLERLADTLCDRLVQQYRPSTRAGSS